MSQPKPTYLVIGAMKCATSTVCAYLEDHRDVYCVPHAEPNYFSHDHIYADGPDAYLTYFKDTDGYKHRGEGSNYYSARALFPDAAERISEMNPDTKIIYMVRHPIKRIVSAWIQKRADSGDGVPPTVDEAVAQMTDMFVGQSQYHYNLQPFMERFPQENIFVGFMEDLKRDGPAFFAELCAFLEIEPAESKRGHQNPSAGKRVPNKMFTTLNSFGLVRAAKKVLPSGLKGAARRMLETEVKPGGVDLSPAALRTVLETIQPDAEALLDYAGKPRDFWQFTDDR